MRPRDGTIEDPRLEKLLQAAIAKPKPDPPQTIFDLPIAAWAMKELK